jgi:hypothetical protein
MEVKSDIIEVMDESKSNMHGEIAVATAVALVPYASASDQDIPEEPKPVNPYWEYMIA